MKKIINILFTVLVMCFVLLKNVEASDGVTKYIASYQCTVHEQKSSASKSLTLPYMTKITFYGAVSNGTSGKWYKLKYDGDIYYVWGKSESDLFTSKKSNYAYETSTDIQKEIVDLAVEIGTEWKTKYVTSEAGTLSSSGYYQFDCSGFVSYVLETVMTEKNPLYDVYAQVSALYDTTSIYNDGYPGEYVVKNVSYSKIQPGDIIFFDWKKDDGVSDHCAIYMGDDEYVHACPSFDASVRVSILTEEHKETIIAIKRFVPDKVESANTTVYVTYKYAKMYKAKDSSSKVLSAFDVNDELTLHWTNNGNWAYVSKVDGTKGYVLTKNISKACVGAPESPQLSSTLTAYSGKPKLSWGKVDDAHLYKLYRATSKNGTYTLITTTKSLSCINASAKAGKTYYYYVKAVSEDGAASEASNVVNRLCICAKPSIAIKNVASTGKPKITWKAIDGAEKYEIYRATSKNGTYKLIKTTTKTSFINSSAVYGKKYYYYVKAINANEKANSKASSKLYVTCDLARPVITVTKNSSGKPVIKWDKVSGAVKYYVYRSTSENGEYTKIKTTTSNKFTNSAAVIGKTYYYKVIAVYSNSVANSAYSKAVKILL